MPITIHRQTLLHTLNRMRSVPKIANGMSVTNHYRLHSHPNGALHLAATDYETTVQTSIPVEVSGPPLSPLLIPADKLFDIVKTGAAEYLVLSPLESTWTQFVCGHFSMRLVGYPPDDFPDLPVTDDLDWMSVEVEHLRRAADVSLSIQGVRGDNRAHVQGILFRHHPQGIELCSTDSTRLSSILIPATNILPFKQFLASKQGLHQALPWLHGETMHIATARSSVFLKDSDGSIYTLRLLEGDYPETADIVQKSQQAPFVDLDLDSLQSAIQRAALITSDTYSGIHLLLKPDQRRLSIQASNPDMGEAEDSVDLTETQVDALTRGLHTPAQPGGAPGMAVSPKYLLNALRHLPGATARLHIESGSHPLAITTPTPQPDGYVALVMPMRL